MNTCPEKAVKKATSRYLIVNGFNIHYSQAGEGDPLILVHGGGTWHYTFRRNIAPLSRHFRVLAPDIPGHGFTRPVRPVRAYNLHTVMDALNGFMDRLEIKKAHLLGHSWGGGWAIHFARSFPERVGKLMFIGSSGLNQRERPAWEMLKWPLIGRLIARMITRNSVRKGLESAFFNTGIVDFKMVESVYTPLTFSHVRQAHYSYARNLDWSLTETILPHIRHPALVLWGKEDRYVPVAFGLKMADLLPNAKLVILDECGHSPHEEKPEAANRYILDFLLDQPEN